MDTGFLSVGSGDVSATVGGQVAKERDLQCVAVCLWGEAVPQVPVYPERGGVSG